MLIQEVKTRIARGESFTFESTLSGRSWLPTLQRAVAVGYSVTIYFLFLDTAEKALRASENVSDWAGIPFRATQLFAVIRAVFIIFGASFAPLPMIGIFLIIREKFRNLCQVEKNLIRVRHSNRRSSSLSFCAGVHHDCR